MRTFGVILFTLFIVCNTAFSQDTSCGIVWEPPIQLSPDSLANEHGASIAVQGDTIHVSWRDSGLRFPYCRSVDGGKTFEPLRELAPESTIVQNSFILGSTKNLYAFWIKAILIDNRTSYSGWMRKSTDRGTTWDNAKFVMDSVGMWHFNAAYGDTILLGAFKPAEYIRLYRSTDAGNTWYATLPKIIGNNPKMTLISSALHRVAGWTFDSAGIFSEFVVQYRRSTNLGDTWSDSINLSSINNPYAGEPYIASDSKGDSSVVISAWKDAKYGCESGIGCSVLGRTSEDNGFTFQPETRFDERPAGSFTTPAVHSNVMAVSWSDDLPDGGVLIRVSRDAGLHWCPPYLVSSGGGEQKVAITDNVIHVAYGKLFGDSPLDTFKIFYRRGVLLPTSVNEKPSKPGHFELSQNYPNPFNPLTTIHFEIEELSDVSLKVFDLIGREVITLVSERKQPGSYQAEWNGEHHASGVYFYRLTSYNTKQGLQVRTHKMVLLK